MNFEELRTRRMYIHITESEVIEPLIHHNINNEHDFKAVIGLPDSCMIWEKFTDHITNDTTYIIFDESFEIIEPGNKIPIFKAP